MYIFRPVRGYLYDAMAEAKTFCSKEDMEEYLSKHYDYGRDKTSGFLYERVGGQNAPASVSSDDRIGWNNIHNVQKTACLIIEKDKKNWQKRLKIYPTNMAIFKSNSRCSLFNFK